MSKNIAVVPGIRFIMKQYHEGLLIVLQEWGQTQAEAARELGISVTTFWKYLRLKSMPNFHTERGKVLAAKFEQWSTVGIELLFPEAFFTKEFLAAPKTHAKTIPFQLLLTKSGKDMSFPLALPAPTQTAKTSSTKSTKRRKKYAKNVKKQ